MILRGKELGFGSLACDIAALLEERDILAGKKDTDIDLASRLDILNQQRAGDGSVRERIASQSKRLKQLAGIRNESNEIEESAPGILLALAYPDRIARRREQISSRYQMTSGTTAVLPSGSLLTREEFLAIGEVDGIGVEVRVYLAAPLTKEEIEKVFFGSIIEEEEIRWNTIDETVVARRISRLGALVLSEQHIKPHGEKVVSALIDGIKQLGMHCLPWDKDTLSLQQRSEWLRKYLSPAPWPDLSD